MKTFNKSRFLLLTLSLCLLLFTCFTTLSTYANDKNLIITTENSILGKVYYNGFSMSAKKITSSDGIGYCLEIDKNYPSGENFLPSGTAKESMPNIQNILACGYPNKLPSDLNLTSENDAYFATQIAIWSSIEGYDVSKITGDRPEILAAIRNIYNNSLIIENPKLNYTGQLFFYSDEIQDIIILSPLNDEIPVPPVIPDITPTPEVPEVPVTPAPPIIDDYPIINGK